MHIIIGDTTGWHVGDLTDRQKKVIDIKRSHRAPVSVGALRSDKRLAIFFATAAVVCYLAFALNLAANNHAVLVIGFGASAVIFTDLARSGWKSYSKAASANKYLEDFDKLDIRTSEDLSYRILCEKFSLKEWGEMKPLVDRYFIDCSEVDEAFRADDKHPAYEVAAEMRKTASSFATALERQRQTARNDADDKIIASQQALRGVL